MGAIDKVLAIAEAEIGYLEKASPHFLWEKTGNAGYGNYTKYWAETAPEHQGQPWCADFVTWTLVKAFGKEVAKKLLKHYPYIYVPTLASLFPLRSNPKQGDIVCFWSKTRKEFYHTGWVIKVDGDWFETIEGNTSSAVGVIDNGGAVRWKGYYNSALPGTKFITLDWDIIEEFKPMTDTERKEFEELKDSVKTLISRVDTLVKQNRVYHYFGELPKNWEAYDVIKDLYDRGIYKGNGAEDLNLPEVLLRTLVILDRKEKAEKDG